MPAFRLLVFVLLLGTTAAPSAPHGALKSSAPSDRAWLTKLPTELRLTFNEPPELALTRIALRDSAGSGVPLGTLTASGIDKVTVLAPVLGRFAPGRYTVTWEMAGPDGHPVRGAFTFTIAAEAMVSAMPAVAGDTARRAAGTMPVQHDTLLMPRSATRFDAESSGFVVVRLLLYAAMLVVIGAVAFKVLVLGFIRPGPDTDPAFLPDAARRAAWIGGAASLFLLAASLARLVAQVWALDGPGGVTASRIGVLLAQTRWGASWIVQVGATLVVLVAFAMARRPGAGRHSNSAWTTASLAALILAFTPAFASHAATVQGLGPTALIMDGLHVTAVAGWLGSLVVVIAAGIPAALAVREDRRGCAVADLFTAFSPTALAFAALVAVTGVFAAWIHVGGFAPLWEAKYGKLLLAKIAVLSVLALTGAYNWLRVKPALGTVEGAARIQRSARTEIIVGIVVLVVTSVLVATPTPADGM